jgi:2,4-dienoyl-CoA reductase-like NADH-dependent reductase (Old Yellow Enzyme family)
MVLEIIKLIKKTTNLHVHCKVNLYQDEEDSLEICRTLAENGADSLQITRFLSPQYFRKGQSNQDMLVGFADKVAKSVSIPVVLGGGRSDMDKITELLNNTDIDFISMQRPFVKDPAFLTRWKNDGHGKSECKTCNNCYWKKESICLIEDSD